jgi:hypothetical protein
VLLQLGAVIDAQGIAENLVAEKNALFAASLVSDASASSSSLPKTTAGCITSILLMLEFA